MIRQADVRQSISDSPPLGLLTITDGPDSRVVLFVEYVIWQHTSWVSLSGNPSQVVMNDKQNGSEAEQKSKA